MTAYAYLRKSVVHDPTRENSEAIQEAAVRAMAARHGDADTLVLLSDWDKSGRLGRSKRPGYDGLWKAIESGACTAVYSYSMSRLARSVSELTKLFETCAAQGIPVRLEADVVDTSTASGRMTAAILASVAAFEADVAGERMRAAMVAKSARGETLRTVPLYGDRPNHDVDAVLAAWHEAGSFNGTARLLNERRVPCRNSRRGWWPSSVARLIRRLDPSVGISTQGARPGPANYLLARLLRCGTCGTPLTGKRDRDGNVRYACRLAAGPHPRASVPEAAILPAIQEEVAHLRAPEAIETAGDDTERAELESRRARVIESFMDGTIDRADRDRRLAAISDALGRLETRSEVVAIPAVDWSQSSATLNGVLRALFERVDVDPETFQPRPDGYVWRVPEWRAD
ncbi:MAG: recombinase family protein [Candidatus Limnocylindrales bacterium]